MKLIRVAAAIACVITLAGCQPQFTQHQEPSAFTLPHDEYFDAYVIERGDGYMVIADKNTSVVYMIIGYNLDKNDVTTATSLAITPLYNEDGTLKHYGE